ncbi:MAG: hypothetical protein ACJA2E_000824 [Arenicella sp.]
MKAGLIAVLLLLITACSQQTSYLDDYLDRLENVLDRKAPSSTLTISVAFPSPQQLQLQEPIAELSIREFLSLRECKLHSVIAHRNSQLGKVSSASQRLFSDLKMLHLGPQCVVRLGDVDLASKLDLFLMQKEQNLNAVVWYSLLGQSENTSFWHDKQSNTKYPLQLSIDVSTELIGLEKFVSRVINGERFFTAQETSEVERYLGRLRAGDGGRLLGEYRRLRVALDKANSIVQQRLDVPLCLSSTPTQKARYFSNVVNAHFIENVQKHAVRLDQRAEKLLSAYYALEASLLSHASEDYKAWARQRDIDIKEGQAATLDHVRLIQKLYQQCGLRVGN